MEESNCESPEQGGRGHRRRQRHRARAGAEPACPGRAGRSCRYQRSRVAGHRRACRRERVSTHLVDITDRSPVEALPDDVIARHGSVDGIINNAGIIQPFVRIKDFGYDAIEKVLNVNLYGTLHTTKAFLPHLLQRPEAHIVNMSGMGGFLPVPGQSMYGFEAAQGGLTARKVRLCEIRIGCAIDFQLSGLICVVDAALLVAPCVFAFRQRAIIQMPVRVQHANYCPRLRTGRL